VIAVEDDLLVRLLEVGARRGDVRFSHVHRHRGDPFALFGTELLEKAVHAGLTPFIGEVLDGAGVDVGDGGDVVLAPTC
jgi:hypothetical protein